MYPFEGITVLESQKQKEEVQFWIKEIFKDGIVQFLMKNSHLTKKQLETFLIDVLAEKIFNNKFTYEEKASLRISSKKITRGAFNRSLRQARKNIIKSIYTVLLLGYLGIFDDSSLYPYIEISNRLGEFKERYKAIMESDLTSHSKIRILNVLKENIEETLNELSDVKAMSR